MSEVKEKAAVCEICGGKLLYMDGDNFECESCGINYPKEWVKKKVQEIIGTVKVDIPVQVTGTVSVDGFSSSVESADALYNRALEWLNLKNEYRAIDVLKTMIEKYPGDKRGWQKLTFLSPTGYYRETALSFGDDSFKSELEEVEQDAAQAKEDAVQALCDAIRSGEEEYRDLRHYKFPFAQDLVKESKENAYNFNRLLSHVYDRRGYNIKTYFEDEIHRAWGLDIPRYYSVVNIIGKSFETVEDDYEGYYEYNTYTTNTVITKSVIQKTFNELDKEIYKGGKATLF